MKNLITSIFLLFSLAMFGQDWQLDGTKYPNATNEGDTVSLATKIPLWDADNLQNYFADLGDILALNPVPPAPSLQQVMEVGSSSDRALTINGANGFAPSPGMHFLYSAGSSAIYNMSPTNDVTAILQMLEDMIVMQNTSGSSIHLSRENGIRLASASPNYDYTLNLSDKGIVDTNPGISLRASETGSPQTGMLIDARLNDRSFYFTTRDKVDPSINNTLIVSPTFTSSTKIIRYADGVIANDDDEIPSLGQVIDSIQANSIVQESGTFTPSLIDGNGGATYTPSIVHGSYIKTGKVVMCSINFDGISTSGTPNGALRITGLPYLYAPGFVTGDIYRFINSGLTTLPTSVSVSGNSLYFTEPTSVEVIDAPTFNSGTVTIRITYTTDE